MSESFETHRMLAASEEDAGLRLDRFLARRLPVLSRSRLASLIKQGQVNSGGRTITEPSRQVKSGEEFRIFLPEPEPAAPAGEDIPLDVVHEDSALIVINKPAGLVVHPAAGHWTGTLVNAVIARCGDSLSGIGGVRRPGIVHRLDKDTTGLLVVAKTDRAHNALAAQFADHGREGPLERRYLALVWGAPPRPYGVAATRIGRDPHNRQKMKVLHEGGKEAITHYRLVETFALRGTKPGLTAVASLVECRLETGRTHQIRVHMAHLACPVIGDPVYASGFESKKRALPEDVRSAIISLDRQALHAAVLGFEHPLSGETVRFEVGLPGDMSCVLRVFKDCAG
jgi:23S rRNA pseudouridine1911/1915/1917 synthase